MPREGQALDQLDPNTRRSKEPLPGQRPWRQEDTAGLAPDHAFVLRLATIAPPSALRPAHVLTLQQTLGNQAVLRLLAKRTARRQLLMRTERDLARSVETGQALQAGSEGARSIDIFGNLCGQAYSAGGTRESVAGGAQHRAECGLGSASPGAQRAQQAPAAARSETTISISSYPQFGWATVQLASRTGLAATKLTKGFAEDVYSYWRDEANKDKPIKELVDFMIGKVNEKLPYPCKPDYATAEQYGVFNGKEWTMTIDIGRIERFVVVSTVGALQFYHVARIVEVIFHEARHAEQWFRQAQMLAVKGSKAREIVDAHEIPIEVAQAAVDSIEKLGAQARKQIVAEAGPWEVFSTGKYAEYSVEIDKLGDEIRELMAPLTITPGGPTPPQTGSAAAGPKGFHARMSELEGHIAGFFAQEQKRIEAIKNKDRFDKAVLSSIKDIRQAFDELKTSYDSQRQRGKKGKFDYLHYPLSRLEYQHHEAYRKLEYEKDALASGEAAAKAFERLTTKRRR